MKNKSKLSVFESFEDFVNSLGDAIYEDTAKGGATVTKLGDTGISAVTFPKEGISFGGDEDTNPYILLLSDDVEFQSYSKTAKQTVTVELTSNDFEKPGVYRRISKADAETKESFISPNLSLDMDAAIRVIAEAVNALYGSAGVTADRVKQMVKAMKIIKTDFPTEIAKNKLFTNLYAKIVEINSKKSVQELVPLLGGKRPGNETTVFDGVKAAFKTA
jgi:hypothetical protein